MSPRVRSTMGSGRDLQPVRDQGRGEHPCTGGTRRTGTTQVADGRQHRRQVRVVTARQLLDEDRARSTAKASGVSRPVEVAASLERGTYEGDVDGDHRGPDPGDQGQCRPNAVSG